MSIEIISINNIFKVGVGKKSAICSAMLRAGLLDMAIKKMTHLQFLWYAEWAMLVHV